MQWNVCYVLERTSPFLTFFPSVLLPQPQSPLFFLPPFSLTAAASPYYSFSPSPSPSHLPCTFPLSSLCRPLPLLSPFPFHLSLSRLLFLDPPPSSLPSLQLHLCFPTFCLHPSPIRFLPLRTFPFFFFFGGGASPFLCYDPPCFPPFHPSFPPSLPAYFLSISCLNHLNFSSISSFLHPFPLSFSPSSQRHSLFPSDFLSFLPWSRLPSPFAVSFMAAVSRLSFPFSAFAILLLPTSLLSLFCLISSLPPYLFPCPPSCLSCFPWDLPHRRSWCTSTTTLLPTAAPIHNPTTAQAPIPYALHHTACLHEKSLSAPLNVWVSDP